jgi:hypothetical protein
VKRPRKPTLAVQTEVVRLLRAGVPLETAFKVVLGSKFDDGFAWLLRGAGQHPDYPIKRKPWTTFHDAVVRAQAEAEARNAAVLQRGGPKWAAVWLRARHPEHWPLPVKGVAVSVSTEFSRPVSFAEECKIVRSRAYDPRALAAAGQTEPETVEQVTSPATVQVFEPVSVRDGEVMLVHVATVKPPA